MIAALFIALFTFSAFACNNKLPMSEVVKAIALEPGAGSKSCSDLPQEECLCYDGIDWNCAIIADEMDTGGIYTGKKIIIEDGAKCDAYQAAKAATEAAAAQLAHEKEQACKAIEQMPEAAIDNMFDEIPANVNTIAALRAHINNSRGLQRQHAKNAKRCIR